MEIILSSVYINRMNFLQQLKGGLTTFLEPSKIMSILFLVVISVFLLSYSGSKTYAVELMSEQESGAGPMNDQPALPAPVESMQAMNGYKQSDVASPSDLLPHDMNSQWGDLNTVNQGNIAMPDLLQAGYHIGLDTIGQSLRNANLQERSDPIIPVMDTGPWNKSTIEPDYGRVPLELGVGGK
jgi:hypothetical protein